MSTPTSSLLHRLLAGEALSADERMVLAAKIESFDDETAAALDAVDVESLALALGGAQAEKADEAPGRPHPSTSPLTGGAGRPVSKRESHLTVGSPRAWGRAAAMGLAVAAFVALLTFIPRSEPSPDGAEGIKGPPAPVHVRLVARVGTRQNGVPVAGALLSSGAMVSSDTAVLFRYRLTAAAWGYLVAEGDGAPTLLYSTGRRRAGEHEVATDGQAMALFPVELGSSVNIVMLACSEPIDDDFDWALLASIDAPALARRNVSCARDGLLLRTEPPR